MPERNLSHPKTKVSDLPVGAHLIDKRGDIESIVKGYETINISGNFILKRPLESVGLSERQEERFFAIGGLINPKLDKKVVTNSPDIPIIWKIDFRDLESTVDGTIHKGFDLWKIAYRGFREYDNLTEEQAKNFGLYPYIYYRNNLALGWFVKNIGGRLISYDNFEENELEKLYNLAPGSSVEEKLASLGQAALGWYGGGSNQIYDLGVKSVFGIQKFVTGLSTMQFNVRNLERVHQRFSNSSGMGGLVVFNL